MEELKLLEIMLKQLDQGQLQDYRGDEEIDREEYLAESDSLDKTSPDGIVQVFLDEARWKKEEDLVSLTRDPDTRTSFNLLRQRCAFQVLLERKGEQWVRKLVADQRDSAKAQEEWEREQGGPQNLDEEGFSAGGREEPGLAMPLKDAKRAKGKRATRRESTTTSQTGDEWGHMETWIEDQAKAREVEPGRYRVSVDQLDLFTKVHIRSPFDSRWSSIEEFEDFYGGAHDTSFATYDGVLMHENQHVQERTEVFNKHLSSFRSRVAAIEASTAEEAIEEYEALYDEFEARVDEEYFAIGEVPARALEWEYYHRVYEAETGERGASLSQARSAGAALGKRETEDQQTMMMSARASEPTGQHVGHRPEGHEGGVDLPPAMVDERVLATMDPSGSGRSAPGRSAGDDEVKPTLLALLSSHKLAESAGGQLLRFAGARPIFGLGKAGRQITGAKAGVSLSSATVAAAGASLEQHEVQGGVAVSWLLRWWDAGGEDQEAVGSGERN